MISGDLRIDVIKADAERCLGSYSTMVDLCEEIERLNDTGGKRVRRWTGFLPLAGMYAIGLVLGYALGVAA